MPRTVYRRALPDIIVGPCPTTSNTLGNSTVTFENFTIGYVSVTCPVVSCPAAATKRATIEQRDPICSTNATCGCYPNLPLDKKLLEQQVLTGNVFTGTTNCTTLIDMTTIVAADCTPLI